jgi:hypothetical protein
MKEFGPYAPGYGGLPSQQQRTAHALAEMQWFVSEGYALFGRESRDTAGPPAMTFATWVVVVVVVSSSRRRRSVGGS